MRKITMQDIKAAYFSGKDLVCGKTIDGRLEFYDEPEDDLIRIIRQWKIDHEDWGCSVGKLKTRLDGKSFLEMKSIKMCDCPVHKRK